jgi:N-acyl-L-homoserine lactone synthetase
MLQAAASSKAPITCSIASDPLTILAARQLCHDVYLKMGYIDSPYPSRIIPRACEWADTYGVARDAAGSLVGTIRMSEGAPLSVLRPWKGKLFPQHAELLKAARRSPCFAIGALAVNKSCAPLRISQVLYIAAYQWALTTGKDYGIITMDTRALRALRLAGWNAITVGEPIYYLGSLTTPALIPIHEQVFASTHPETTGQLAA